MKSIAPLAAVLSLCAASAHAQPPDGAPGRHGAEWRQMRHQEMMTDLHTVLRVRPEQEGAFQTFAAAMEPRPHDRRDHGDTPEAETLTTPQLIDRMDARHAAHDAEERQRSAAVKRFYAALSPDQQQVFDALRRLIMGPGGWGGHGPHGVAAGRGDHGPGGPPQG